MVSEMEITFPILKNAASRSSVQEESKQKDSKASEEVTERFFNRNSITDEKTRNTKNHQNKTDLLRKRDTKQTERNRKARQLIAKVVEKEEESKRISKEKIATQKLKDDRLEEDNKGKFL
ncbi:MAG: hypothetical protein H0T62_14525 [Parachlamydiaceae bacterium]|nr:hypothetical protein [Parachlamydiaceae bacterium]